jgi:hypothetical protein
MKSEKHMASKVMMMSRLILSLLRLPLLLPNRPSSKSFELPPPLKKNPKVLSSLCVSVLLLFTCIDPSSAADGMLQK